MSARWNSVRTWIAGGRRIDVQGAATEEEKNVERDPPKMSVSRNDPVQTNKNSPARPRLTIDNELPFKILVLAIILIYAGVYS